MPLRRPTLLTAETMMPLSEKVEARPPRYCASPMAAMRMGRLGSMVTSVCGRSASAGVPGSIGMIG